MNAHTGGEFDENGDWHDDHPELLQDDHPIATLIGGLIRIGIWVIVVGLIWYAFKFLVNLAVN